MNQDEIEYMEKIVEDSKNDGILKLSLEEIERKKIEILEELYLTKLETKSLLKKLKRYRYVDEIQEIKVGNYFRWINLSKIKNLKLTNGGILCEIKIEDDPIIIFKNYMNKFFQTNLNEVLLFQKLSLQEEIILYAIKYINK